MKEKLKVGDVCVYGSNKTVDGHTFTEDIVIVGHIHKLSDSSDIINYIRLDEHGLEDGLIGSPKSLSKANISEEDAKSLRRHIKMREQIEDGMMDVWKSRFPKLDYDDIDSDPVFEDLQDMINDVFCQNAVLEQHRKKIDKYWRKDAPWEKSLENED